MLQERLFLQCVFYLKINGQIGNGAALPDTNSEKTSSFILHTWSFVMNLDSLNERLLSVSDKLVCMWFYLLKAYLEIFSDKNIPI